jgi:hypothetical protein
MDQASRTGALLVYGQVAGPIYIAIGVLEMLFREGFDTRRHALSLMANGEWGWIHSSMMVATGLLTIAGAAGMRRAMRGKPAGFLGPLLLGVYGLGVAGAGVFSADPALGFPPGTPLKGNVISTHGMMHFVCGGIGFAGLIAACLVFAWAFVRTGQTAWAVFSAVTGVIFFATFFGVATLSQRDDATRAAVTIAFSLAVALAWVWLSMLANRLRRAA